MNNALFKDFMKPDLVELSLDCCFLTLRLCVLKQAKTVLSGLYPHPLSPHSSFHMQLPNVLKLNNAIHRDAHLQFQIYNVAI